MCESFVSEATIAGSPSLILFQAKVLGIETIFSSPDRSSTLVISTSKVYEPFCGSPTPFMAVILSVLEPFNSTAKSLCSSGCKGLSLIFISSGFTDSTPI